MSTPLRQVQNEFVIRTRGRGLHEFTHEVERWAAQGQFSTGLLTLHLLHTSASLLIQENADPDVQKDLRDFFAQLATRGMTYRHTAEGPDDMPSHVRAALTQTSIGIPLRHGKLALGTWQGIYLFEHRDAPHRREVVLHLGA